MDASFCTQMARAGFTGGKSVEEIQNLLLIRFSNFKSGTECPKCGEFDLHWIEQTQNHIAVIRRCRSCTYRWEQF